MNFKKIAITLVCGFATVAAMGQSLTTRVFSYDGSTATNGIATYTLYGDGNNTSVFAGVVAGSGNANPILGYSQNRVDFSANTQVNVGSYVYISGTFGGTFNVQGIGSGNDVIETNLIQVKTNRSLSFTASGFYGIGSVGNIAYSMNLYQDWPSNGTSLGWTGYPLIDTNFNGAYVGVNASTELPVDGCLTLALTRTLTLNQSAIGGQTYNAGGVIKVGVN
jgi:hypothetical protein